MKKKPESVALFQIKNFPNDLKRRFKIKALEREMSFKDAFILACENFVNAK